MMTAVQPTPSRTSSEVLHNGASLKAISDSLDRELDSARSQYLQRLPVSKAQHELAIEYMPGGNTRSVLFNEPFPIVMKEGRGNRLWDYDGYEYLDLVGELTAGLYGHSNSVLKDAILSTLETTGVSLGATTKGETRLAELLCERFPAVELVRFCNSGTEANLYALGLAKHVTGKSKVIAFNGGYHGGVLSFGNGVSSINVDKKDWVLGTYNDIDGARNLIENTLDVAAVIVEAMQGAGGCLPATSEFLHVIQATAQRCGVLVILDEVMTSRLHPHGLQGDFSLNPDLTTFGKYIGGGMAVGAFGGRKELLASCDPRNPSSFAHSGTFNNNTLTMSCGFRGLSEIYTTQAAIDINRLGDYFRERLEAVAKDTQMRVTGIGAVLTIHFQTNGVAPVRVEDLDRHSNKGLKKLFWFWCLSKGFWITERGMLSIILGTSKDELDSFVQTVSLFLQRYSSLVALP